MCKASLHEKEEMLLEIERFGSSREDVPEALQLSRRIADSGRSILLLEGAVRCGATDAEPLEEVFRRAFIALVSDNDPEVVCRKLTEVRDELSRRRFELVKLLPTRS